MALFACGSARSSAPLTSPLSMEPVIASIRGSDERVQKQPPISEQFQERTTLMPFSASHRFRSTSANACSGCPCCEPSSSRFSFASKQKKSRMCGPSGCCRRNLYAEKRRSRSQRQRSCSAQVSALRSLRATAVCWGDCLSMAKLWLCNAFSLTLTLTSVGFCIVLQK